MAVGNYHFELGTAAMSVIMPVFNVLYSLGLMVGIGGGVLYSNSLGKNDSNHNKYFTSSMIFGIIISIIVTLSFIFFERPILTLFGGRDTKVYDLASDYFFFIKIFAPFFIFNQILLAFLRNDNSPLHATIAVLIGGIFNVFGDFFFVFTCDMGIKGAGLATSLGACITTITLLTHFIMKKNTLRLDFKIKQIKTFKDISINGFSAFILDFSVGVVTIIFNTFAIKYFSNCGLAIYGLVINIAIFVQCLGYAIGQASQPLISNYYGMKEYNKINEVKKLSIITSLIIGTIFTIVMMIFPKEIISLFIKTTPDIINEGITYLRLYSIAFIILPLNIFITYYFQSIIKSRIAFILSSLRGYIINIILLLILPLILPISLWFVVGITELLVLIIGLIIIKKTKI